MDEEYKKQMAEIVRMYRKAAGLTQRQLGLACGYSEASAERVTRAWELATQPVPTEKLKPLANALHITLDALLP